MPTAIAANPDPTNNALKHSDGGRRPSHVHHNLVKGGIVSDVLPEFFPSLTIRATFDVGSVEYGNEFAVKDAQTQPEMSWLDGELDAEERYTVALVDPDAPSRTDPKNRCWRHWLVTNVKGDDITSGHVVTPYQGPAPPKGTGPHRYVLVLLRHPNQNQITLSLPDDRGKFNIAALAQKHDLTPVGANWFVAKHV
ncbi:hypothetical protein HDV00_007055 [Rhizophlyctis rosea]|nr:hypothetical protein HDV00_007055 [Rhizophlyctis rosea]